MINRKLVTDNLRQFTKKPFVEEPPQMVKILNERNLIQIVPVEIGMPRINLMDVKATHIEKPLPEFYIVHIILFP